MDFDSHSLKDLVDEVQSSWSEIDLTAVDENAKQFVDRYEELKTLLASDKHLKEEQNKTESTIEVLKEAQIKADGCLQKFESNKRKLKTKIASRQASVDKLKKTVNTGLEIWKMLGLSVEELGKDGSNAEGGDQHFNGNLAITFTKVDQQNPSAAYVVKVNVTNNKVKIYETEPRNFLSVADSVRIETAVNGDDPMDEKPFNFRFLAVLLRRHILESISNRTNNGSS